MPSPTPLHESYCTISRDPPNQGDVLEGLSMIAASSAVSVTEIVKAIHREIVLRPLGIYTETGQKWWSRGLTAIIYKYIQTVMQVSGSTLAYGLRTVNQYNPRQMQRPLTPILHRMVSALNGIMGDHLIYQQNPMALPMGFYSRYGVPQRGEVKGDVIILTHGLCMDQHSWHFDTPAGIGNQILEHFPDSTVLYTSYNTGRRISQNGYSFSEFLEELTSNNPNITGIHLIGHSMGGLVSRSALFYAKQDGHTWINKARTLICLGSPHHGAVLERLGYLLQSGIGKVPFAGALAKIADIRSAGIIDLRHGSVRTDDWEHLSDRVGQYDDNRKPAPLPRSVNTFFVAGTMQKSADGISRLHDALGDLLVSVDSALGEHPNPALKLKVPDENKAIFYSVNHMELQYEPLVINHVIACLTQSKATPQVSQSLLSMPIPEKSMA